MKKAKEISIKTLEKDISQDMKRKKTNTENYLNIFILLIYSALFGLSIYCTYRCYDELYTKLAVLVSDANLNKLDNVAQSTSLLLTSFLILLSLFLGFSVISIIRWFTGVFGKGEHITFFVFNIAILILSFIVLLTFGVLYTTLDDLGVTLETTSFCFYTSLFAFIFSVVFILFYIVKPGFLMH